MILTIIVAMARNRVIGRNNALPWRLPADLQHFRRITLGKPVVMGRKTYESIGRPLPGRDNIVVSTDRDYHAIGCRVTHSIQDTLASLQEMPEVMVIGGASLYQETLACAGRIYLTLVHADVAGDTWFPELDAGQWRQVNREDFLADERNNYDYSFIHLERVWKESGKSPTEGL